MIINSVIAGGGIKEEDITAEFLQTLDPDFTADNIAEGVDLFGLVGTHSGAKVATGTAIADRDNILTVSGLGFTPVDVAVYRSGYAVSPILWCYGSDGKTGVYIYGTQYTKTVTKTITGDGFTYNAGTNPGRFEGTYHWIAWSE